MKKIILFAVVLFWISCNNDNYPESQEPAGDTTIINKDTIVFIDTIK